MERDRDRGVIDKYLMIEVCTQDEMYALRELMQRTKQNTAGSKERSKIKKQDFHCNVSRMH